MHTRCSREGHRVTLIVQRITYFLLSTENYKFTADFLKGNVESGDKD